MQVLVLASGSQYRAELLNRLNRPFQQFSPNVDESPKSVESAPDLATRLAKMKSEAPLLNDFVGNLPNSAIVIASDQVAAVDDKFLGKPGTLEQASKQLCAMRGKTVSFYTALYLRNTANDHYFSALDVTTATLRALELDEIERYLIADNPIDCAGSFKVESLGISLFERIESSDPTALVGLPMIQLCKGLRRFGLNVP